MLCLTCAGICNGLDTDDADNGRISEADADDDDGDVELVVGLSAGRCGDAGRCAKLSNISTSGLMFGLTGRGFILPVSADAPLALAGDFG